MIRHRAKPPLVKNSPHLAARKGGHVVHGSAGLMNAADDLLKIAAGGKKRRKMSAKARKAISNAQKARWAKQRGKGRNSLALVRQSRLRSLPYCLTVYLKSRSVPVATLVIESAGTVTALFIRDKLSNVVGNAFGSSTPIRGTRPI